MPHSAVVFEPLNPAEATDCYPDSRYPELQSTVHNSVLRYVQSRSGLEFVIFLVSLSLSRKGGAQLMEICSRLEAAFKSFGGSLQTIWRLPPNERRLQVLEPVRCLGMLYECMFLCICSIAKAKHQNSPRKGQAPSKTHTT